MIIRTTVSSSKVSFDLLLIVRLPIIYVIPPFLFIRSDEDTSILPLLKAGFDRVRVLLDSDRLSKPQGTKNIVNGAFDA